jgi:cobalt-zinc-cadmium resistance protein CzcA
MNADDDIVQGIVLMRQGEQSSPTIARVEKAGQIDQQLEHPATRRADRTHLRPQGPDRHHDPHRAAQHGGGHPLIVLLQWLFLGNLRSAVIVGATIPFALFFAVIIMVLRGESANLLSVGAIDFGLIVDGTVIMVEAIFRRLSQTTELSASERQAISPDTIMGMKSHAILSAAADVSRSIFFAAAIIIAAFLPLFTLSGVEGHIFGPMAKTYAYALAGGLLATFTITRRSARSFFRRIFRKPKPGS